MEKEAKIEREFELAFSECECVHYALCISHTYACQIGKLAENLRQCQDQHSHTERQAEGEL